MCVIHSIAFCVLRFYINAYLLFQFPNLPLALFLRFIHTHICRPGLFILTAIRFSIVWIIQFAYPFSYQGKVRMLLLFYHCKQSYKEHTCMVSRYKCGNWVHV